MRGISESFMTDLKETDGVLHSLLSRVKCDDTLMLAIRENYICIYYRGCRLISVTEVKKIYKIETDKKYLKNLPKISTDLPKEINDQESVIRWVSEFPFIKENIDLSLNKDSKIEREFQQLVVRENNSIRNASNETDYFVTDIELAGYENGRFDMIAIKLPADSGNRRSLLNCSLAIIEMKYGDNALSGDSGIIKHLTDVRDVTENPEILDELIETAERQFNQLFELGLIRYNKGKKDLKINKQIHPEFILLLANTKHRSSKLSEIMTSEQFRKFNDNNYFDLKFSLASFNGYALYSRYMLNSEEITKHFSDRE